MLRAKFPALHHVHHIPQRCISTSFATMAARPITSLAPELLQEILRACDSFSDLTALASSCKTIYAVWNSKAPSLLWDLAPTKILAFNAALMAVSLGLRLYSKGTFTHTICRFAPPISLQRHRATESNHPVPSQSKRFVEKCQSPCLPRCKPCLTSSI